MGQIGPWQLVIILVLVVVIFGSKKLPDTARALGRSLRILKSETSALRSDGESKEETAESADSASSEQTTTAPRTIKAAPGDVASARPVEEPQGKTQS